MKTKLILFLFLTINLGVPLGFIPFNEASAQEFTNSTGTYFDFNNGTVNHLTFANGTAVPQIVIPDPATPPDFAQLSETPFTVSYDLEQFPDQTLNIIDNGNTITIENKGVSSVYNKDTCSLSLFNPNEIESEFAKESWTVESATWGSDNWNGLPVNSESCETGFTNTQHTATINAVRQNDDGIFRVQYSFDLYSIKTTVYYTNYNENTFGGINNDGSVWYGNPTKFGFVNSFSNMQTDVPDLQDGFTQSGTDFVINEQYDIEYKFLDSTRLLWGINNNVDNIYIDFKKVSKPTQYGQSQVIDPHLTAHPNEPQNVDSDQTEVLKIDLDWDLPVDSVDDSPSLSGVSFTDDGDISAENTRPNGIMFSSDGTKFYISDEEQDTIEEYSLSTAWDVTTLTHSHSKSIISVSSIGTGHKWSSDGLYMYVTDVGGEEINRWSCTAWDLSSCGGTHDQQGNDRTRDNAPYDLAFKTDGTKLFIYGHEHHKVYGYTLSTAWDLTTMSYVDEVSTSSYNTNGAGLHFNDDGTKMFTSGTGGNDVEQWDLSTAWDLTTATHTTTYDLNDDSSVSDTTNGHAVFIGDSGSKMYTVGWENDFIYQYDVSNTVNLDDPTGYRVYEVSTEYNTDFDWDDVGYVSTSTSNIPSGFDSGTSWLMDSDNARVSMTTTGELFPLNSDFTWTGWYRPSQMDDDDILQPESDISSGGISIGRENQSPSSEGNKLDVIIKDGGGSNSVGSEANYSFSTDEWHLITVTFDASAGDLNAHVCNESSCSWDVIDTTNSAVTSIGSIKNYQLFGDTGSSISARGQAMEFAVWDRILTQTEIENLWNNADGLEADELTSASSDLRAYWDGTDYTQDISNQALVDTNTVLVSDTGDTDTEYQVTQTWGTTTTPADVVYSYTDGEDHIMNCYGQRIVCGGILISGSGHDLVGETINQVTVKLSNNGGSPTGNVYVIVSDYHASSWQSTNTAQLDWLNEDYVFNTSLDATTLTSTATEYTFGDGTDAGYEISNGDMIIVYYGDGSGLSATNSVRMYEDNGVDTSDNYGLITYTGLNEPTAWERSDGITTYMKAGNPVNSISTPALENLTVGEEYTHKVSALNVADVANSNHNWDSVTNLSVGTTSTPSGLGSDTWLGGSSYTQLDSASGELKLFPDTFTFSFWIYPTDLGEDSPAHNQAWLIPDSSAVRIEQVWHNPDHKIEIQVNDGSDNMACNGFHGFSEDNWYNVVWTFDGSTGEIYGYVNNSQIANCTNSSVGGTADQSGYKMIAGNTSEFFKGSWMETAIWNKVLSSSERSSLYASGNGVLANTIATSDLRAYWDGSDITATITNQATSETTYESDLSSSTSWTLTDDLPAPTNLTAQSGIPIQLDWDDVANAVTYQVYRDSGSGFTLLANAGSDSDYDDSSTVAGTSYDYKVSALGPSPANLLESALSSQVTATAGQPPDAITTVTATISNAQTDPHVVTLTWGEPSDWQTGTPQSYEVFESVGSSGNMQSVSSALTYVAGTFTHTHNISGIQPLTDYYYLVRATSTHGTSADSNIPSVTTVDVPVKPDTPVATQPDTTATPYLVSLSWSDNGDGGSDIKGHQIDRWDSNSNAWTTIETDTGSVATTYQDTSIVSPAIDVRYKIGVINGVGVSTLSDQSNTITIPDIPLVPNNVSCTTDSSTQITVTWQVPTSDGGSALTYYNVYQPHPSNQVQYATNVYTHVATGLTSGTLYQFDVSAQNNVGDGSYASCTATTSIAPAGTFQITQDWIVYDTMEVSYLAVVSAGNPSPTVEDIKIKLDGTTVATVPVGQPVSIGQQLTGTLQIKLPDLVQHDLTADMRMTNTGNEVTVTSNTLSVIATFLPTYKEVVEGTGLVAWDLTRDETQTELNIEIFKDTAPFNVNCALLTPEQASKTVDKKITSMNSHGVGSTLWQNATSVGYHNATSTVNGNLSYYVFCYEQSNPYLLMFSDVSYSTLGSALASGLSGLEADLGLMLGGPLISIFVVMLAGQATGRTAPTFIILVLVAVGILMGLGFFVIDEAIWGLILIMGSLGVLVGKKFL